jgi:GTPase SAR1 family protein
LKIIKKIINKNVDGRESQMESLSSADYVMIFFDMSNISSTEEVANEVLPLFEEKAPKHARYLLVGAKSDFFNNPASNVDEQEIASKLEALMAVASRGDSHCDGFLPISAMVKEIIIIFFFFFFFTLDR